MWFNILDLVPPWDVAEVRRRCILRKGDSLSRIREYFDQNKTPEMQ